MPINLQNTLKNILDDGEPSTDCQTYQSMIHIYVDAVLASSKAVAAEQYPALKSHLDTCEECHTIYADTKALLEMERAGTLITPTSTPVFDFSYLQQQEFSRSIWQRVQNIATLTHAVEVELRSELAKWSQNTLEWIDNSLEGLIPNANPVPVRHQRDRNEHMSTPQTVTVNMDDHFVATLIIGTVSPGQPSMQPAQPHSELSDSPLSMTIGVRINTPSGDPLSRVQVQLFDHEDIFVESTPTDSKGEVSFTNMHINCRVEIVYEQKRWQLPIEIQQIGD